jgi:hypothetical protein
MMAGPQHSFTCGSSHLKAIHVTSYTKHCCLSTPLTERTLQVEPGATADEFIVKVRVARGVLLFSVLL